MQLPTVLSSTLQVILKIGKTLDLSGKNVLLFLFLQSKPCNQCCTNTDMHNSYKWLFFRKKCNLLWFVFLSCTAEADQHCICNLEANSCVYKRITGLDEQREQALRSFRVSSTARSGSMKYDLQVEGGGSNPILSYTCLISKLYAWALCILRQILHIAHSISSLHTLITEMQFYKIALESSSLTVCTPVSSSKA